MKRCIPYEVESYTYVWLIPSRSPSPTGRSLGLRNLEGDGHIYTSQPFRLKTACILSSLVSIYTYICLAPSVCGVLYERSARANPSLHLENKTIATRNLLVAHLLAICL